MHAKEDAERGAYTFMITGKCSDSVLTFPVNAIYQWLGPLDTSEHYNAALEKHQSHTGSWFLAGTQYVSWKRHPNQPMWISGARELLSR